MTANDAYCDREEPDRFLRDALVRRLQREAEDADGRMTTQADIIAGRLVEKAVGGEFQAIKEIFDRVEGRAPQGAPAGGDGPAEATVRWIDTTS